MLQSHQVVLRAIVERDVSGIEDQERVFRA